MTFADPLSSVRDRPWSKWLGWGLVALAAALIIVSSFVSAVPNLPSTLLVISGFIVGTAYQFLPFLHAGDTRAHNPRLGGWLVALSAVLFVAAVLSVALRWAPPVGGPGLLLLAASITLLLIGLTELYPDGHGLPGLFLVPVGLDGLMLQSVSATASNPAGAAVALLLFLPGTGAAVVLTVWAFRVRGASKPAYAKATETARGVLWAWMLLLSGVLVWNGFHISYENSTLANPVVWALPLVTLGSVLAAATAGWSKYVEARAELESPAELLTGPRAST